MTGMRVKIFVEQFEKSMQSFMEEINDFSRKVNVQDIKFSSEGGYLYVLVMYT